MGSGKCICEARGRVREKVDVDMAPEMCYPARVFASGGCAVAEGME